MKKVFVLFVLALLMMVSCNTYTDKHALSPNNNNHNGDAGMVLTEVNSRSGEFTENVVTRGFQMSEHNPNFMSVTNTNGQQSNDIKRVREEISKMDLYRVSEITVNGNDLRVTAYYDGNLTAPARAEAEEDVRSHLLSALPHYSIEIIVREERS